MATVKERVPFTGLEVDCPLTGFVLGRMKVIRHKIRFKVCKGGGKLTGFCRHHMIRIFIMDFEIVDQLMERYGNGNS